MPIIVKVDEMLHERRMTLTELSERIGITLANLSILKTGKARAMRTLPLPRLGKENIKMKHNVVLTITSLLSILFLTLHITDDIVRGISKAEPSNIALAVLVVLLYGTLVLAERRSGYVIMLLVGLFAAGMPVIHMRGAHYG